MPARIDAQKAWRQMREMRRDFDYLRKKYGGIPEKGLPFRRFSLELIKIVDGRTRKGGFDPFPVVIDRKAKEKKPLDEVTDKGNVKPRNSGKKFNL